jgi:hypothetical protein
MASNSNSKPNIPLYSLTATVLLVGMALVALLFVDTSNITLLIPFVGLIVSTVPSLIAAAYSEKTSRDIHNGVLSKQVSEGTTVAFAHQALKDPAALQAIQELAALVKTNTDTTETNTAALNNTVKEGDSNGG